MLKIGGTAVKYLARSKVNLGEYYPTGVRECFNMDFKSIMVISINEESFCKHVIQPCMSYSSK